MDKISLAGCVIIRDGQILLLHRIKSDWYELPGGKIETGESPEEAAKRELIEELKCSVEIIREAGIKSFKENGWLMDYHWFLAKIFEGQSPQIGEPERFDHFKYIPLVNLGDYNLSPNMNNFLNEFGKGSIKLELVPT